MLALERKTPTWFRSSLIGPGTSNPIGTEGCLLSFPFSSTSAGFRFPASRPLSRTTTAAKVVGHRALHRPGALSPNHLQPFVLGQHLDAVLLGFRQFRTGTG